MPATTYRSHELLTPFPMTRFPFTTAVLLLAAGRLLAASAPELEECRISAGPGFPGIEARCGTLTRPLDPADPGGHFLDRDRQYVP